MPNCPSSLLASASILMGEGPISETPQLLVFGMKLVWHDIKHIIRRIWLIRTKMSFLKCQNLHIKPSSRPDISVV